MLLIGCLLTQTGCLTYNYFLSPFNANQNPYQATPLKSDSIKGATYASVVATVGGANEGLKDNQFNFRGSIHRSNTFENLHLYYGGSIAFGSYKANALDFNTGYYGNNVTGNLTDRTMFFGGLSMTGGMHFIVPVSNGGEWRIIGIETSVNREFGDYLSFRKNFPDSFHYTIDRNALTGSLGLTTEIIGKRKSGGSFGYKFAIGIGFNGIHDYYQYTDQSPTSVPLYATHTLHYSRGNWTGFWQLNLGYRAASFQFGAEFMLGNHRR
jgi:hypothetical protein